LLLLSMLLLLVLLLLLLLQLLPLLLLSWPVHSPNILILMMIRGDLV
jgi:hypothetical protein